MKLKIALVFTAVAVAFVAAHAFAADDIAWGKMIGIDVGKLTSAQKAEVAGVLHGNPNTRGCDGTIAACLKQGDMTARRHAGYVARMVRKNKDRKAISQGLADRHESAFPREVVGIDVADHPYLGHRGAPVVLVEYACFQCPFCAHLAPKMERLTKKFGNKLVYYYKFFPVRSHKRGVASALAGLAAYRQGKFWELAAQLFENRSSLSDEEMLAYAKRAGLDIGKYKTALVDQGAMRYIEKDKLEGMRIGVDGTPGFYINGKAYVGLPEFPELVDRIGEELDIIEGRIK